MSGAGSSTGGGIDFKIQLLGAREFAAAGDLARASVKGLGAETKAQNKVAQEAAGGWTMFANKLGFAQHQGEGGITTFKKLRETLGGFTAAFVGYEAVKSSIETNEKLVVTGQHLTSMFHMSSSAALKWSAASQVLGIQSMSMEIGFRQLATAMTLARQGGATQTSVFAGLGISTQYLTQHANDMNGVMQLVVQRLGQVHNGSERAYMGQVLMGRGYRTLTPLLIENGQVFKRLSNSFGEFFKGKHLDDQEKFRVAMIDYRASLLELQITFAESIEPALIKTMYAMRDFVSQGEQGKGLAGGLVAAYKTFGSILSVVYSFLSKHKTLVKTIVLLYVGWKGAVILYNEAMLVWKAGSAFVTGITMGIRLIQWQMAALNIAMDISTGGIFLLMTAAVAAGFAFGAISQKMGGPKATLEALWRWIEGQGAAFGDALVAPFKPLLALPGLIEDAWNGLGNFFTSTVPSWFDQTLQLPTFGGGGGNGGHKKHSFLGIPGLATGGTVSFGSGSWITGERGPEINSFDGSRVRVQPLSGSGTKIQPLDWSQVANRSEGAMSPVVNLRVPVVIGKKQIAEVEASYQKDVAARR